MPAAEAPSTIFVEGLRPGKDTVIARLIDSHGWSPPREGTALKVMRDGKETGVVMAGTERQGSHVIADIVTGTPRKGDQVFQ